MARSDSNRSVVIAFRVTPAERDLLEDRARINGCDRSELIRRWVEQPPQSVVTVTNPATFVVRMDH